MTNLFQHQQFCCCLFCFANARPPVTLRCRRDVQVEGRKVSLRSEGPGSQDDVGWDAIWMENFQVGNI